MADEPKNKNKNDDGDDGDFKSSAKPWLIWLIILALIPMLIIAREKIDPKYTNVTRNEFFGLMESNLVIKGTISYSAASAEFRTLNEITGTYKNPDPAKAGQPVAFRLKTRLTQKDEEKLFESKKFEAAEPNTLMMNLLITLLPFVFIAAIFYFFFIRQIKMAGKGALSFGKSKARMLNKEKNKTTFKDVAGIEEAKEEVCELVDFLKDPKKFQKLGGRIPKGVLMVGPPGTGKTLLAKAIAGEADAAFFSISGSDFVEMFVGVGASRVRDMFEQARKNTPCLVFIDEIDAVGRSRGVGLGGGNDEREQTLNALLVEMDGFDTQEGIIIIAATNRADVLDPALMRPGRFDRRIIINLPDVRGREAILKVHAKNVKLEPAADLAVIARGTPGYSGAELANLLNEAALLAAKESKKFVTMTELNEARDKVRWGRERRSLAMSDENKKLTAWHEAGHALVNVVLPHTHPLHKVTIIPRGPSLGSTMSLPKEDILNYQRREMLDMITVMMAGRIAEELVSGDISTGAGGDIQQATHMARAMVCQYGMSDKLGMIQFTEDDELFLGRDMLRRKGYSEHTAEQIDDEVRQIINRCYQLAKDIITTNRDKLEIIAKALLEHESLDGTQVHEIVRSGTFTPPTPPAPPDAASAPAAQTSATAKPVPPKLEDGLGTPAPAAA
jgi:cell division protease FtsH